MDKTGAIILLRAGYNVKRRLWQYGIMIFFDFVVNAHETISWLFFIFLLIHRRQYHDYFCYFPLNKQETISYYFCYFSLNKQETISWLYLIFLLIHRRQYQDFFFIHRRPYHDFLNFVFHTGEATCVCAVWAVFLWRGRISAPLSHSQRGAALPLPTLRGQIYTGHFLLFMTPLHGDGWLVVSQSYKY